MSEPPSAALPSALPPSALFSYADLSGRVALVTGASRGIGRAIALQLAACGADVAVNYVSRPEGAEESARAIEAVGRRSVVVEADVSEASAVTAMMKAVTDALGPPDILVNNAGITRDTLILRMSDDDWDAVLATDLRGAFLCTRACLRGMMKNRWGRIINVGSVIGTTGNAGQANYAAAKAGLAGLTKAVAREVGSRNITANLIAPGFIQTEITADLSADLVERVQAQIPLERLGRPEEVAPLVAFLAGEGGRYITGQIIHIDGGMVMS